MNILAPSILSADFSELASDVKKVEEGGATLLHIDVMDGHFVPNISFGADVMKCLVGKTKLPFDVHLMIEDANSYIKEFATENTEYITVHQEATRHLDRTINLIKSLDIKAGVAINPATPIGTLAEVLSRVDMVLIMSVNPGFGGQQLIPETLNKVRELVKIRDEKGYDFLIELDGGVTPENAKDVVDAGVQVVVAGSSIFKAEDVEMRTKEFVKIIE